MIIVLRGFDKNEMEKVFSYAYQFDNVGVFRLEAYEIVVDIYGTKEKGYKILCEPESGYNDTVIKAALSGYLRGLQDGKNSANKP